MTLVWRGSRPYYYQSYRRDDGRVSARYVGSGDYALALATLDQRRREKSARFEARLRRKTAALHARIRQSCRDARAAAEALDGPLEGWSEQVDGLFYEIM